ncbi:hypothetical protein Aperf_G00000103619 [Anoplocephala perfoliata]
MLLAHVRTLLLIRGGLFILFNFIQEISAFNASQETFTLWNLHGAQNFYPCRFIKSSSPLDGPDAIFCDKEASATMGNSIPTVHPEGKVVREIRIHAGHQLSSLPHKAFEKVGAELHRLFIQGGEIRIIKREALSALTELEILEIRNSPDTEGKWPKNGLAGRLFTGDGELKHLKKLRRLALENVDLSDGLASFAFYDMSRHLEVLDLKGNNLEIINPYAFEKSETVKSLKQMSLESQNGSLAWLNDAYRWARDLGSLNMLSLSGNNLTNKTLDFGHSLNNKLRAIKIENCSLTEVPNELLKNFNALEEIYVGGNSFKMISTQEATEKLWGLKRFTNLTKLSLAGNTGLIYKQPPWFRDSKILELNYSKSVLRKIGGRELPRNLEALSLESTFLEEIEPDWAAEVPHLTKLYLNSACITSVKINGTEGDWETALKPLGNQLKILGLVGCKIISRSLKRSNVEDYKVTRLRLGLQYLRALESLDLSGNYLTYIPLNAFQNMSKLVSLHLSNNHIQTIATIEPLASTDRDIPEIQELDLTNNALSFVIGARQSLGFNVPLKEVLAKKARLKLSGNPITCDCRIRWLMEGGIQTDNFLCVGKNQFTGQVIRKISVHDLTSNYSRCPRWDSIEAPDPIYPFRPVRVFGYDRQLKRVYFAVKGSALKSAWENAVLKARMQPFNLQEFLAKMNNLTPETVSKLQKEYLVFEVAFWPVGEFREMEKTTEWQVVSEDLVEAEGGRREYVFSVEPINVKRAYTVCFRNALERRNATRSTLCQIFQPSELTMSAKTENPPVEKDQFHAPLWFVVLVTASVVLFICCIFCLCVKYRCCRKKKKPRKEDVKKMPLESPGYPRNSNDNQYEKLENYYLESSLPNLSNYGERPELPKRIRRSRVLPPVPPMSTGSSLGDLTVRRYRAKTRQSRLQRQSNQYNSTPKLSKASPKLPRPLAYQRPKTIGLQPSTDENGYVKMNVDNEDYLEARPEKRMRREGVGNDSYIMGMPRAILIRQESAPANVMGVNESI